MTTPLHLHMNMPVETLADPIVGHARAMLAMRGVEKQHSATATRALRGLYAHDPMAVLKIHDFKLPAESMLNAN